MLKVRGTNAPRLAYYPYHNVADFTISISCSDMFSENEEWSITLKREGKDFTEEFETWKTVFKIEGRFLNEIEEHYESWIIELLNRNINSLPEVIDSLDIAINDQITDLKNRAVVPGYFLHKEFWKFVLISEDIVKEQILFFIRESSELVA
jgi:predicted DNA-binding protein (MmcQ/YjbR family)